MNHRGFTLLQSIIAIAIVSVLALGITSMIVNGYQHSSRIGVILEGREFQAEFSELSRSERCGITDLLAPIAIKNWADDTEYELTSVTGRFLEIKPGDVYNGLKVQKISIAPYYDRIKKESRYIAMNGESSTDYENASIIRASLKMQVTSNQGAKAPLSVPIHLYLDSAGENIIDCKSTEYNADLENMCTSISGAWNSLEQRCVLPCPAGFTFSGEACVADSSSESPALFCATNDPCNGVISKKYNSF